MNLNARRQAAVHEAGHALVAIDVGAQLLAASCRPFAIDGAGVAGWTQVSGLVDPWMQAAVFCAGEIAERVLRDWTPQGAPKDELPWLEPLERDLFTGDSKADRAAVAALGLSVRIVDLLRERTAALLRRRRAELEAVAELLWRAGVVDGDQIQQAMTDVRKGWEL